jgi:hypothetical protein
MMTVTTRLTLAGVFAASALTVSTGAQALTLNTSGLQAVSVLTFSVAGFGSATAAGVSFVPLGNMTKIGDVEVLDPEIGETSLVPSYNQPVTKADIKIGWDLKITPQSGQATRSALQLVRNGRNGTKNWVVLANFDVSFKDKVLYGDVFTSTGTVLTRVPVYSFKDNGDLKISLKGLSLNMTQTISELYFNSITSDQIASVLALSAPLKASLVGTDWGTIAIKVNTNLRIPKVSNKPLTIADIPAP